MSRAKGRRGADPAFHAEWMKYVDVIEIASKEGGALANKMIALARDGQQHTDEFRKVADDHALIHFYMFAATVEEARAGLRKSHDGERRAMLPPPSWWRPLSDFQEKAA